MSGSIREVIVRAESVIDEFGHAASTRWQYRAAWGEFEGFCAGHGHVSVTGEAVSAFLLLVADEYAQGKIKAWKYKLLRKAALVLSEVSATGSYAWKVTRQSGPNDTIGALRPVQEQFEGWLAGRALATATRQLYATVSRTVLAWWPGHGVTEIAAVSGADVSAAVVFLGGRYRPGSMRTVLTAVRVLARFLEDRFGCVGLSRAVPRGRHRRVDTVQVLPDAWIDELVQTPDMSAPTGRRDRALLLLAARTGLRPVDLAGLRLPDIDWREARITLTQHKTGRVLTVPLLADVGDAIADYLLHDRPAGVDEHVFLRSQAPFTGLLASDSLYHVTARAFARVTTPPPSVTGHGFRVLRASFATRMLRAGAPLPVISGALGHRDPSSAGRYLAADEVGMRECCLDFTGIEPAGTRP